MSHPVWDVLGIRVKKLERELQELKEKNEENERKLRALEIRTEPLTHRRSHT